MIVKQVADGHGLLSWRCVRVAVVGGIERGSRKVDFDSYFGFGLLQKPEASVEVFRLPYQNL